MAATVLPCAKPCRISEAVKQARALEPGGADELSMRIVGRLVEKDASGFGATLAAASPCDSGQILVALDLVVDSVAFATGASYMVIGELAVGEDRRPRVRARVARNVQGMDIALYHKAVDLCRKRPAVEVVEL